MKKFKLLSLLLILTLFLSVLPTSALAVDAPATNAQSVLLMDADTGEILYQKNAGSAVDPGALTVLMTALVVGDSLGRQNITSSDVVTLTAGYGYNLTETSVRTDPALVEGEILTVEQLLYLAALTGAEDAANALAEYVYDSPDAFVAEMNRRAQELGCTNTNFVNAGGTFSEAQHVSAHDLAVIARAVFQSTPVLSVFQAVSYTVPATNVSGERNIATNNALLNAGDGRYYERAHSGKTAYTGLGSCLVSDASYNGLDVIAVVLGCPDGVDVFTETQNLFEWVFANYGYRTLVSSTDVLDTIPVSMGNPGTVSVRTADSVQVVMPNDREPTDVTYDIVYQHDQEGTDLQAPINVGQYLGEVTIYMNGVERGSARLVAATAVDISRLDYLRTQLDVLLGNPSVRQTVTILLGALGVYLLLVNFYRIQRAVHLHSLRRARKARAKTRSQQELEWLELPRSQEPELEQGPVDFIPEPADDEPEEADEAEDVEEAPAPDEEPEAAEEEAEYTEEPEAAEEEPEYVEEPEAAEEEPEYAEEPAYEEGPFYEDEAEYAEEEPFYEDEDEYAGEEPADEADEFADEEFIDDEEFIEDDDGYYEDEDDGGEEPPAPSGHRRWGRR